uniref:Uncharacterized protein n=1 Tax=Variovorax paradoxus (strain S110) TaxID=543728 RepID=C5CJL5_VARPS
MSKKLTPWFPAEVEPAREGIYNVQDRRLDDDRWFSYWDGVRFNWLSLSQGGAFLMRGDKGAGGDVTRWRGLAVKP